MQAGQPTRTSSFFRKYSALILYIIVSVVLVFFVSDRLGNEYDRPANKRFRSDADLATVGIFLLLWLLLVVYWVANRRSLKNVLVPGLQSLLLVIPFYFIVQPVLLAGLYGLNLVSPGDPVSRKGIVSNLVKPGDVWVVEDLSDRKRLFLNEINTTLNYPGASFGDTVHYTIRTGLLGIPRYMDFRSATVHTNK